MLDTKINLLKQKTFRMLAGLFNFALYILQLPIIEAIKESWHLLPEMRLMLQLMNNR